MVLVRILGGLGCFNEPGSVCFCTWFLEVTLVWAYSDMCSKWKDYSVCDIRDDIYDFKATKYNLKWTTCI